MSATISNGWNTSEPPKDGTQIVAFGRILWTDDFSAGSSPFSGIIHWQKCDSGYEGWLYGTLSVIRQLEDVLKIDYWLPLPDSQTPRADRIFQTDTFEVEP